MTQTVLLTGATGYLGRQMLHHLAAMPDVAVVALVRQMPDTPLPVQRCIQVDLTRADDLTALLAEVSPTVVFHLAAAPRNAPLAEQLSVNVLGTQRLLTALAGLPQPPRRVVLAGSAAEYGPSDAPLTETAPLNPVGPYGLAKATQTQLAWLLGRQLGLPVCVGRVFNVYGRTTDPGYVMTRVARQLADLLAAGHPDPVLTTYNLQSVRDYVFVDDVVRALWHLGQAGQAGEVYNIASGQGVRTSDLVDQLVRLSGVENLRVNPQGPQFADTSIASLAKIRALGGWQPQVSLADGLRQVWHSVVSARDAAGAEPAFVPQ